MLRGHDLGEQWRVQLRQAAESAPPAGPEEQARSMPPPAAGQDGSVGSVCVAS